MTDLKAAATSKIAVITVAKGWQVWTLFTESYFKFMQGNLKIVLLGCMFSRIFPRFISFGLIFGGLGWVYGTIRKYVPRFEEISFLQWILNVLYLINTFNNYLFKYFWLLSKVHSKQMLQKGNFSKEANWRKFARANPFKKWFVRLHTLTF